MIRIRYRQQSNDQKLRSVQKYAHPSNGGLFYVVLDPEENTFSIIDDRADVVVVEGSATSPHKVKIAAKKALLKLGITFEPELREKL